MRNLLSKCTNLIFSEIEIIKDSSEIADVSLSEIKSLLQEWKQHCNEVLIVNIPIPLYYCDRFEHQLINRNRFRDTKESNIAFWKLCSRWSEFKNNSRNFCQIVECFPIKLLLPDDFVNIVMEDKHVKECGKCKQSVCRRYLDDDGVFQTISDENCLILKDLANRYNCETFKKRIASYIMQRYKTISKRPEFNALVPAEDFIVYMKCCEYWECSEKLSIIASWIRFSPDREEAFPKLFKDEQLKSTDLESLCEMQDALLIKTLSRKYSCKKVHDAALQFIITNFMSIIKLPEFLTIDSMDLISYLQNLKSYEKVSEDIWHSIIRWVYHDFEQREEEFSKVFQVLNLKMFSFTFVQKTICRFVLVRKSCECMSRLLDFILHEHTTNPIHPIQNIWTRLRDIFNREIESDGDLAILPLIYNRAFRRIPSDEWID